MTSKIIHGIVGKTLRYEKTLPSLPVPQLRQTCAKYLESGKYDGDWGHKS